MNWVFTGQVNGLSPVLRQNITWTNADLLSIGLWGTNFSEIQIKIHNFTFLKLYLKMLSAKWQPFCPGGDELTVADIKVVVIFFFSTYDPIDNLDQV